MIEKCDPRMYLILREDLAFKYVQGAHALAQYSLNFPENFKEWDNQHLICLSVFNGKELQKLRESITIQSSIGFLHYSLFIEPDLESELPTAICIFEDGTGYVSHFLKDLRLATK